MLPAIVIFLRELTDHLPGDNFLAAVLESATGRVFLLLSGAVCVSLSIVITQLLSPLAFRLAKRPPSGKMGPEDLEIFRAEVDIYLEGLIGHTLISDISLAKTVLPPLAFRELCLAGIPSFQVGFDTGSQRKVEGLLAAAAAASGRKFWVCRDGERWEEIRPDCEPNVIYPGALRIRKVPMFSRFRKASLCPGKFPPTPAVDDYLLEWAEGRYFPSPPEGKEYVLYDLPSHSFIDRSNARAAIEYVAVEYRHSNPIWLGVGILLFWGGALILFAFWLRKLLEAFGVIH